MKVAATVTALRALVPDADNYARLMGYASAGDGGGGEWRWDSTDTTSTDDGALITVGGSAGRWKRLIEGQSVNVKWWGAKGDNSTDDTAAIQAAVTYVAAFGVALKPELIFPHGYYRITNTITIDNARGVTLRGMGGQQGSTSGNVTFVADIPPTLSGSGCAIGTPAPTGYASDLNGDLSYVTTLTGLSGLTSAHEGAPIFFPSPTNAVNYGGWHILRVLSATSCTVEGRYGSRTMVAETGLTWHLVNKAALLIKGLECRIIGIKVLPASGRVLYAGFSDTYGGTAPLIENSYEYCRVDIDDFTDRHIVYAAVHADHPTQPGYGGWCYGSVYVGYANGDNNTYDNCTFGGFSNAGYWCGNQLQQTFRIVFNRCLFVGSMGGRTIGGTVVYGSHGAMQFGGGMVLRDSEFQVLSAGGVRLMPGCQVVLENCIVENCSRFLVQELASNYPMSCTIIGGRYAPNLIHADKDFVKLVQSGCLTVIGARFDTGGGQTGVKFNVASAESGEYTGANATWIGTTFSCTDPFREPAAGSGHVLTNLGNCAFIGGVSVAVAPVAPAVSVPRVASITRAPATLELGRAMASGSQLAPTTGVLAGINYTDSDGGTTTQFDGAIDQTLTGSVYLPSSPVDGQIHRVRDAFRSSTRRDFVVNGNGKLIDGSATLTLPNVGTHWFRYNSASGAWTRTVRL